MKKFKNENTKRLRTLKEQLDSLKAVEAEILKSIDDLEDEIRKEKECLISKKYVGNYYKHLDPYSNTGCEKYVYFKGAEKNDEHWHVICDVLDYQAPNQYHCATLTILTDLKRPIYDFAENELVKIAKDQYEDAFRRLCRLAPKTESLHLTIHHN